MVALAIGAGVAVASTVAGAVASSNAADAQVEASQAASATQQGMQNQIRADLSPYRTAGLEPLSALNRLTGTNPGGNPMMSPLLSTPQLPGAFTQADLEATPGYQFTRDQGIKAVMNMGAKAGFSGGTLKQGAQFATGLADSTYHTRFGEQQTNFQNLTGQQQNVFNRLLALAGMGQSAAAQTGEFGAASAARIGENQIGAGNAQAAGSIGIGNAISNGANGIGSAYMYNQLYGGGGGGGGIYDLPDRYDRKF